MEEKNNTEVRLNARYVGKWFNQVAERDFSETFSWVVKTCIIKLVLASTVQNIWNIKQLDIKNAFLHELLKKDVFVEKPQGFKDEEHSDYVWKLKKALLSLSKLPEHDK